MKFAILFIAFFSFITAQEYQAPLQLSSLASISHKITKIVTDPICAPTTVISCCTHYACEVPCPHAVGVGFVGSCLGLYFATNVDIAHVDYYSLNALAALKNGILTAFPCMQPRKLVKKKTE